ncbi:MAG TPA: DUF4132 domain-containing protein, partial [Gemmataceae bacterium]
DFDYDKKLDDVPAGKTILAQDRETQAVIVSAVLDRLEGMEIKIAACRSNDGPKWHAVWWPRRVLLVTLQALLRRALPLSEATLIRLFQWPVRAKHGIGNYTYPLSGMATAAEHFAEDKEISGPLLTTLKSFIAQLRKAADDKDCRKIAERLQTLLAGGPKINLEAGEAWSDAALADLRKMKAAASKSWNALMIHCQTGGKGKFTERWGKEAQQLVDAVGFDSFKEHLLRWFPLVDKPRTQPRAHRHEYYEPDYTNLIIPEHVELLRGLVWCCGFQEDAELARAVAKLALSAYRKLPGVGPRLVSLGNACVTALGMMPGLPAIGQLAILKTKVKSGSAQKEIEKAFTASAAREQLPRDEIEELAVPSYGLESVGLRRETFDDYQAELLVDGTTASLHWLKDGKPLKSAPAAVKKDHAEEFKELQASIKDINSMLPAQRERLDTLFLARKNWPLAIWKERYLNHPLIGAIARRLIWSFAHKDRTNTGIWHGERLVDANDKPLNLNDKTIVSLWHPIDQTMDDILAWRDWLERREVVQPFKQAHREVYLLTDAERRTRTYSNRFAAHILRQHQFNALCAARGWKNKLRLMVDDSYPPAHRPLRAWNLRAEYWIEGAGSNYGQDTNETGTYLYLSTDQVRFYRIDAEQLYAHAGGGGYSETWSGGAVDEPLPLETVPPLVFSEIMRDVDLFVGVASVGNDPNWADGGPNGQYRDYWQSYSFGELSATAQTRKALLERLLPRLKIADRCTLAERFLIVRGSLRTYKLHLGSGNILMEPNDQYLCIVPKQTLAGGERVFLPFEGDGTLSIVLSKAFLLADDAKITDPTITSQLKK